MPKLTMSYIDADVYSEAKKRISHIIDIFDHVFVCFSGGKDSLVTLKLTEEVYEEKGIDRPVGVIFRDEELIPDDVIKFVTKFYDSGKYDFRYYAVPLYSHKYILGVSHSYIQWDPNRKWIRDKPDFAIKDAGGRIFDQFTMDEYMAKGLKGKVCFMLGIRADESLARRMLVMTRVNENYITESSPKASIGRPIYDWSIQDIFKYFYDKNVRYCPIYDAQIINGHPLRVATPFLQESAKHLDKLQTLYPVFFDQLMDLFPEMLVQARYQKEYNCDAIIMKYPHTWDGIIKYIKDNITDPREQRIYMRNVLSAKKTRENRLKAGKGLHNFGGFPLLHVMHSVSSGSAKKRIQPQIEPSQVEIEYEGGFQKI